MNKRLKSIINGLFILCVVGCAAEKTPNSKTIHPTKENLSVADTDHFNVINPGDDIPQDESLNRALETIKSREKVVSVGDDTADEITPFGRIADVEMDDQQRIYVLDERTQEVRVFDKKGEFLTTLGSRGKGPGEFESARSMSIHKNETLLVNNGYRMEVFDIREDGIEFVETYQFDKNTRSICTMGGTLFVHHIQLAGNQVEGDTNDLQMISAYELPSFEPLFSFGESYKSDNMMVADRLSAGDISCNEDASTVLFVFEKMPMVHGYSAEDGELRWASHIDGLHFSKIEETYKNGSLQLSFKVPESRTVDQFLPPVTISNKFVLLQSHRNSFSAGERKSKVLSVILDSSNGQGSFADLNHGAIAEIMEPFVVSISDDYVSFSVHEFK